MEELVKAMNENLKLDQVDRQILGHLLLDARKTFTDIAKELNVSSGTVHIRVKKWRNLELLKGRVYNWIMKL